MDFDDDDGDAKKFDRKILIASIFFLVTVVSLVFLLHFYFKYLNRRRESRRRAALHRLISRQIVPDVADFNSSSEAPNKGLEPAVLDSFPAFKFKADHNNQQQQLDDGEITECSVCLGTIVKDAMVRVLPNCKHMFHSDCIDAWFKSNITCPICRTVAEPVVQAVEKTVQPSAPPLEENRSRSTGGGSGFQFGSFRWMVGRESSSTVQRCEAI